MKKIVGNLPLRLPLGAILGIIVGQLAGSGLIHVVVTIKYVLNQVIVFCVSFIITGFIAPSITRSDDDASEMLGVAIIIVRVSSTDAVPFSMTVGLLMTPHLSIATEAKRLKDLPEIVFQLDIPQIMPMMSTLAFPLLLGLAATWTKAAMITQVLEGFQQIVLFVITRVVIPILPVFIAFTFYVLSHEGTITKQLPVSIQVIIIVMIGHYIRLALLYAVGSTCSGKSPLSVIENYESAYTTTVGTMSSVAILAVVLHYAKKSQPPLGDDTVDFGIPLSANAHLCGSILTGVFFVTTISKVLYGTIPSLGTMILFYALLGVSTIGTPGVPGDTATVSLGLITGILGFDETGAALVLTVFTLQDSFGAACNVTGDGVLTMTLTGFTEKHGIKRQKIENGP